jgi:hypothetical protein
VDALQTVINSVVVAAVGLVLVRMTTNLRQELKADIGRVESRLKEDFRRLQGELKQGNLRLEGGLKEEIGRVEGGLKEEIGRVQGGLNAFRAEWKLEMAELRAEIRETRSDLTRVALAVGAERRAGRQEA